MQFLVLFFVIVYCRACRPMKLSLSALFGLGISTLGSLFVSGDAIAQVTSDGTVNTEVNQNGNVSEITGGETRGENLFHSFQEFSVGTGGEAFFNNAETISNIFSRVTGGSISNIDGLIRANGGASLFLINPAGIVFGENASLDIGGSFYGSSADSILFEDGEFSATDLENPPLLTINAPIGLSLRDDPGNIVNRSNFGLTETILDENFNSALADKPLTLRNSIGLKVNPSQSITLIGGNVILEDAAGITAPGGRVELGGLSEAGIITFNNDSSLTFPEGVARGDVSLSGQSRVNAAASGGGFINVNARNLTVSEGSRLFGGIPENMGSLEAQAGDININATDSVNVVGSDSIALVEFQTGIYNDVGDISIIRKRDRDPNLRSNAFGNSGSVLINTNNLVIEGQGRIGTNSLGTGNAGDINIKANNISLNSGAIESLVRDGGIGNSGNVKIQTTNDIFVGDGSNIQTQVIRFSEGNVGNIIIDTGSLTLNEFSFILSDNQVRGDAGDITINATDSISLNGFLSGILSQIQNDVIGNAGNVSISAPLVSLSNFSLISTNVKKGSVGRTGDIFLDVETLKITDGAVIDALTENNFQGGDIIVNANLVDLRNGGKIVTSGEGGGNAGSIKLNVADNIILNNGNPPAEPPFFEAILQNLALQTGLFANTVEGSMGDGGNIVVEANSIQSENGSISAETSSGQGGNVILKIGDRISLQNNSVISAQAGSFGDGGNINIDTNFIVTFPNQNNDIIANAQQGQGGKIEITAESLFGIEERSLNDSSNDINASSAQGAQFDGTVSIITPEVDAIRGATQLPDKVVEAQQTTDEACAVNAENGEPNSLTVKGTGGLPAQPIEPLESDNIIIDGVTVAANDPEIKPIPTDHGDIYPARGIIFKKNGDFILTAYPTDNVATRTPTPKKNCNYSNPVSQ
jgi:filamentous hemagglutinin family protein